MNILGSVLSVCRKSRLQEGLANLRNTSALIISYTLQFLLQFGMKAECKACIFCRH
jgi:hypothetical protein